MLIGSSQTVLSDSKFDRNKALLGSELVEAGEPIGEKIARYGE